MNKKELIAYVAKKTGKSFKDTEITLNGVLESIVEVTLREEPINLLGFGSFSIKKAPERMGYNPSAKKPMQIPAKRLVKFKPGAKLILEK